MSNAEHRIAVKFLTKRNGAIDRGFGSFTTVLARRKELSMSFIALALFASKHLGTLSIAGGGWKPVTCDRVRTLENKFLCHSLACGRVLSADAVYTNHFVTPACRGGENRVSTLEGFPDSHTERVAILALCNIEPEINIVFFADFES